MKMVKEVNGRLITTDITGYREMTPSDVARLNAQQQQAKNQAEIKVLKRKLQSTDYQAIKFAEGEIPEAEYLPIREQRKQWRARINELETTLNAFAVGGGA